MISKYRNCFISSRSERILITFYFICCCFLAIFLNNVSINFIVNSRYNNNRLFFSIIIPVFNKLRYLNRSFSSILCQNYTNYEIRYCDDGSNDGSFEYIRNLSFYYPKIHLIRHNENLGTLNTRVDAINSSKGEYIVSLDPDDEYECGILNELYKYLSHKKYDIVEFQNIKWQNKSRNLFNHSNFVVFNRSELLYRRVLWSLVLKCFRRKVLLVGISHIPPELFKIHMTAAEDLIILLYTLIFCQNYLVINYGGYIYYQYLPGASSSCGYINCKKKKTMVRLAWRYAKRFWMSNKINFVHILPK